MTDTVRVPRGGWSLAAEVSGRDGDAPVLVLSNSLGATRAMWDGQMPMLRARFRVVRYDTRGHGGSDTPQGPYAFDDLVGDVLAVMDHLEVGRADYMGLSLGGMTGLGLALTAPKRVGRLVVCAARADAPPAFVAGWDDRIAAIRAGGIGAIWAGTRDRWLTPAFMAHRPDAVEALRAGFMATTVAGYEGCARALQKLDYLPRLGALSGPVTYIAGAEDMGAPADAMREMAEATPGAAFHCIEGAAHVVNVNAEDEFNRLAQDALTGESA